MLSWLVPLALTLIVTPIIVRTLGSELYGLYAVILGFISYSFSFGIGKTAAKYVSEYKATNENEKIGEVISSIIWLSLGFGVAAIIIIALISKYLVVDILQISADLQDLAITSLYLASLTILISMISQVFQFTLQGLHRFDRYLLITNLSGLLLNLGSVAIVLLGYGVVHLVAWNCFVAFIIGFVFYLSVRRLLPAFSLKLQIRHAIWKDAVSYALSIVAYQSLGNILLLFERAWIVRKFGTEELTYYVVPMALCIYFFSLVSSFSIVVFPVVNELLTDRSRLIQLYKTASKLILTMTVFFILTSLIDGRLFLDVWMKGDFAMRSYPILTMHVLTFSICAITVIAWQTMESFGAARVNALATVSWVAISIPLMVVLSDVWRTFGIAAARSAGVLTYFALIVYVERKFLGGVLYRFWLSASARLLIAAILAGGAEWFLISLLPAGWFSFVATALTGVVVFAISLLLSGFLDHEEKAMITNIVYRFRHA